MGYTIFQQDGLLQRPVSDTGETTKTGDNHGHLRPALPMFSVGDPETGEAVGL